MPDTFHIQISIYVKADTIYGARAAAKMAKRSLDKWAFSPNTLDEVIIVSVGKERDKDNQNDWTTPFG